MLIPPGTVRFLPFIEDLLTRRDNTVNVSELHRLRLNSEKMAG